MGLSFKSILIVTYGRSGSTLLQGVLNSVDGVLVRGENYNFLEGLYLAYCRLQESKMKQGQGSETPQDSWYGAAEINLDIFLNNCEAMVKDVIVGQYGDRSNIQCYGFKEIRYLNVEDLSGYLDFLKKIFPQPLFVFIKRDIDEVVSSGWWADCDPDNVKKQILEFEERIVQYLKNEKGSFYEISYSDLVTKAENLRGLFDLLGAKYIEKEIDFVLSKPHSAKLKSIKFSRDPRITYIAPKECDHYLADYLIDGLPEKIISQKTFSFGGVVIPNEGIVIDSIKLRSSRGEFKAKTGISSPEYYKKYPLNRMSAQGRFLFNGISLTKNEEVDIVVETTNKNIVKIGSIKNHSYSRDKHDKYDGLRKVLQEICKGRFAKKKGDHI